MSMSITTSSRMRMRSALSHQSSLLRSPESADTSPRRCGFRTMQTLEVTSEDAPTLKIYVMKRVPFPKSIELS